MKKVQLSLDGFDGNAFSLMAEFQRAARRQGWSRDEIEEVLSECTSGDYDHLLITLMKNTEDPNDDL